MQGLAIAANDAEPAGAEHRRFRRVKVDLPGRLFVSSGSHEVRCTISDLSPGGASVICQTVASAGSQVVLYVDGFGCFEGKVVRRADAGFGLAFVCSPAKREQTAEQLTLFLNKALVGDSALRRHERFCQSGPATFTRADGQVVPCQVMDISMGGVSLKTDVKPPVDEFVLIAQMAGRVARHHEEGIALEFVGQDKRAAPLTALLSFALKR